MKTVFTLFAILFISHFQINAQVKVDPKSDCKDAIILCHKKPLTINYTSGKGLDSNEILKEYCIMSEDASSWFKWTCDTPGTFTFVLTPKRIEDDLDFMVFEIENLNDACFTKKSIRCVASACKGPTTGLSATEIDIEEGPGCPNGNNNYVKAIDMKKGASYALIVNNFSLSGLGYDISFGGDGTILGPCGVGNPTSTTGISKEEISLFPNPASNYFEIHAKDFSADFVKILNISNKIVWQGKISQAQSIDISNLLSGLYFVQIIRNNKIENVKKLVKL